MNVGPSNCKYQTHAVVFQARPCIYHRLLSTCHHRGDDEDNNGDDDNGDDYYNDKDMAGIYKHNDIEEAIILSHLWIGTYYTGW